MQGLNLRLPICKNGTLPAELIWQRIAGDGLEPTTSGVWTLRAIQLLYPAVPDARIELTASWSQTRRSTKLSQSGICSRKPAAILQVTGLQKSECCHHTLRPCRSNDPTGAWTRNLLIDSQAEYPIILWGHYIYRLALQVYIRKYIPALFLQ